MRLNGWLVAVAVSVLVSGGLCGVAQGCWKVDLDIHHGQSGSLLPEDLEDEAHGATTVANLNDTDGDGVQDKDDNVVEMGDPAKGRNEVDLMRLILRKPDPDMGGEVTLRLVSGNAKVWEKPTKETLVTLPVQYQTSDLPKTLWVEATAVSSVLRDIELKLTYGDVSDSVNATAVWVEKTTRPPAQGTNSWCTRQTANGWPHNPKVGAGGHLPNCDEASLVNTINVERVSYDGSRYGFGTHTELTETSDDLFGGRILYEWKLLPEGVESLAQHPVVDVTRQAWVRCYEIEEGKKDVTLLLSKDFPWQGDPPYDCEEANDDTDSVKDEDNEPTNHLVYSWDNPALPDPLDWAFGVFRATFKEWVRIKLENEQFPDMQNVVAGSRASEMHDWHIVMYLKRKDIITWDLDNISPSACEPSSHLNGWLAVTVNAANCETEGWTVTYDEPNTQWLVKDADAVTRGTLTLVGGSDPRQWTGTGSKGGNVWVTLTVTESDGRTFDDGDDFKFSTFKSISGKENHMGPTEFNVGDNPE